VGVIDPSDSVPSAATFKATMEFWAALVMKYTACAFADDAFAVAAFPWFDQDAGLLAPFAPFGRWWCGRGLAEAARSRARIAQAEDNWIMVKKWFGKSESQKRVKIKCLKKLKKSGLMVIIMMILEVNGMSTAEEGSIDGSRYSVLIERRRPYTNYMISCHH
jgi:hypothetical protein